MLRSVVSDREAVVDRDVGQQALIDQLVQQALAQERRVDHGGVELRAHALAELFQLIAVGLIELGAGNGLARDRGQLALRMKL